jgi:hypothetical protein
MRSFHFVSLAAAATAMTAVISSAALAATPTISQTSQKMPTFNGGVYATAYLGTTIYVGGSFTSVAWGGIKVGRAGLAAIDARTGALLPWAPTANGKVDALATDPGTQTVYVAGDFSTINGANRDSLAGLGATNGTLTSFKHTVSGEPRALAVGHGLLYFGGHFSAIDAQWRSNLAAFSLSTGALSETWKPTADDAVYGVTSDPNRIYLGGKFRKINGISGTAKLAAVSPDNATRDATFKPSVAVLVYQIAIGPNGIFAAEGGQGGTAIGYSTAGAVQWRFTTDGDIQALAYLNGVLYTGGHFDNACKTASTGVNGFCNDGAIKRVKFAAVDATDGTLTDWDPAGNGVHGVFAMAANASLGTVAAGGEFTTLAGASRGRFAQFH